MFPAKWQPFIFTHPVFLQCFLVVMGGSAHGRFLSLDFHIFWLQTMQWILLLSKPLQRKVRFWVSNSSTMWMST